MEYCEGLDREAFGTNQLVQDAVLRNIELMVRLRLVSQMR